MTEAGLRKEEWALILSVLRRHGEVTGAILFGSRAKGTEAKASDIDLALEGIDDPLRAEKIAGELEELPLPYRFDIKALSSLRAGPLREHIARAGIRVYPLSAEAFTGAE